MLKEIISHERYQKLINMKLVEHTFVQGKESFPVKLDCHTLEVIKENDLNA